MKFCPSENFYAKKRTANAIPNKWRSVQDSNLCIPIQDDGLAIRCITTLPTLRNRNLFTLSFFCRQSFFEILLHFVIY